ncbi:MAG TPA: Mur ligase family protein [Acidimicrobiales bacterium]|nr:Mur ligase family protein [Acidimicrobiales bacterium]
MVPAATPGDDIRRDIRILDGPNRFLPGPAVALSLCLPTAHAQRSAEKLAGELAAAIVAQAKFPAAISADLVARGGRDGGLLIAFPRHDRQQSEAFALALSDGLAAVLGGEDIGAVATVAADRCRAIVADDPPSVPAPTIPTIAVTGTNGKTTVTRLAAHIAGQAGHRVARCDSDGVYDGSVAVERGDWTGFLGVRRALGIPGATFAALEIARGGILRRGLGATDFDVSVVTNIAADHLGSDGVDTLGDMAEVKSAVVGATRPSGVVVVNAEDPLALAMRRATSARPFGFALSMASPGLELVLREGGAAISLRDHEVVWRDHVDATWRPVLDITAIPITFGGKSRHSVANALAAAAAALGCGIPLPSVVAGLQSFTPSAAHNPGRMNAFQFRGIVILVDYGHNEEGLTALMELARALVGTDGQVHLVLNGLGDRPADLIFGLARIGAQTSDTLVIAERESAPRGRPADEHFGLLRAGAEAGGKATPLSLPTEVDAARTVVERAAAGDVCAIMCHAERVEMAAWLDAIGAAPTEFAVDMGSSPADGSAEIL